MEKQFVRLITSLLFSLLVFVAVATVSADDALPVSGILNPDSASELGIVTTLNASGEEGVFIIARNGEIAISMLRAEIVAVSNEMLGGFLSVYEESGQALFEMPDGSYQMQLTTSNGVINLSYLNQNSTIQSAELLTMEEEILLQASADEQYQLYLLTTGELSVLMRTDDDDLSYQITFTGIPALNIKEALLDN